MNLPEINPDPWLFPEHKVNFRNPLLLPLIYSLYHKNAGK